MYKFRCISICIVVTSIIASCDNDSQKNVPEPVHPVTIRVTGVDAKSLEPSFTFYIKKEDQPQQPYLSALAPESGSKVYSPGSWNKGVEATLVLTFNTVTTKSSIQPVAGSQVTGELLVDGKVKATVVLDRNSTYGNFDHPNAVTKVIIGN